MSRHFICDVCNKEISDHERITIEHTFGYFSSHDGSTITLDMHERCFEEMFHAIIEKNQQAQEKNKDQKPCEHCGKDQENCLPENCSGWRPNDLIKDKLAEHFN